MRSRLWMSFLLGFSFLAIFLFFSSYVPLSGDRAARTLPSYLLRRANSTAGVPWNEWLYPDQPCHKRTITVVWIVKHMFGSALWSGYEIAQAISKRYGDLVVVPMLSSEFSEMSDAQLYARLRKEGLPASEAPHLDLCLFLKFADDPVIDRCRRMKAATAMLWVDGHPHLLDPASAHNNPANNYTYHIVPNTLTGQHYPFSLESDRTWLIPQHDSRPDTIPIHDPTMPVKEIAWQGGYLNRMSPYVRNAISRWAEERGIEFREHNYVGTQADLPQLIKERDQAFMDVVSSADIMVIFPAAEDTFNKLIYKPNGRNIFALSMGIPTVLFPYVSYTEALKWSQYPAFASSVPELLRWLEILVERTEAREELSRLGLEFAQQLSLDNVCRMWAWHLRTALCDGSAAA